MPCCGLTLIGSYVPHSYSLTPQPHLQDVAGMRWREKILWVFDVAAVSWMERKGFVKKQRQEKIFFTSHQQVMPRHLLGGRPPVWAVVLRKMNVFIRVFLLLLPQILLLSLTSYIMGGCPLVRLDQLSCLCPPKTSCPPQTAVFGGKLESHLWCSDVVPRCSATARILVKYQGCSSLKFRAQHYMGCYRKRQLHPSQTQYSSSQCNSFQSITGT